MLSIIKLKSARFIATFLLLFCSRANAFTNFHYLLFKPPYPICNTSVGFWNNSIQGDSGIQAEKLPEILLSYKYEDAGVTYNQYGQARQNRSREIVFSVGEDGTQHIKHFGKTLGVYLQKDPKAYACFKKYAPLRVFSLPFLAAALIGFGATAYIVATDRDQEGPAFPALIIGFTGYLALNGAANHTIKKSVKIYNQDAGYGYKNGLEKPKKASKEITL